MKPYSRFCRLQVSFLLLVVYALLPIEQAAEDPPGSERSARRPEWNPDEPEGSPLQSIRFGTVDPEISARLEGQGSSQTKTTETKKKKKKEKSKTSQQPASPVVEHLHGLLLNPSEHLDEENVLEIVREFLTGADMGLAEPVVNAVAVSLADQITKVGKKERSGMLAELRALAHLADPDIKRHRYQALFAPANDAILVIQVPGTSETAPNDEWAETEAIVEAEAAPKPKSKGKGKQHKKKGAGTVHKGEVSMPPKGAKGKGHTAVKEKGKEHEEKTPKTTTLIPNGNELLAQLRADTKWLEKGGGTSRTKKQQQISTTAGGKERSSWEGEADVPWLEGDPRTNQALGTIAKWTPKLLLRIRIFTEIVAHRFHIDVIDPRVVLSGWIDALARLKVKTQRAQAITELAHLRSLPAVVDSFLRYLKPKAENETDRDYIPRFLAHVRALVAVSRLPVFSKPCPVREGGADAATCPACYTVDPKRNHNDCPFFRALFIQNCYFIVMASQLVDYNSDQATEIFDLLRRFKPNEEEFVGWYFHKLAMEIMAVRQNIADSSKIENFMSFEEVKAAIVALFGTRSAFNASTMNILYLVFSLRAAERNELMNEFRRAQPIPAFVDQITQMYMRIKRPSNMDMEGPAFCACLSEWTKRLSEVNEELPGVFHFPRESEDDKAPISTSVTLRDLEYVDVRVHLVQELWPLRDGTSRRRVYDAIREAQLVVDQILYIILTPELSCELKPVDFVSGGTLEGKWVDEEAFTEELIRSEVYDVSNLWAIELAGGLTRRGSLETLCHSLYALVDFFTDSEMRRKQLEAINDARVDGDCEFVDHLSVLDTTMYALVKFVEKASVSADQEVGTSRWRNMPVNGQLRHQWRKALREKIKGPVEAFHEKLLEYWHISGPILKAPWRRVFTRGDKDKDEEEFSESLADLVAQLVKIPKDERDEVTAVLTRPSPTSQKGEPRLPFPDQVSALLKHPIFLMMDDESTPNIPLIDKFVGVYARMFDPTDSNLKGYTVRQKYAVVMALLCLPSEKRVGILHFLDADSRQTLDRFAGEEHLPQVEFAAKMEPYLEEVETALLKAFDLLPSEGAGEKVVSLKQLLQPQSLVLSPKKMPSLASPKESGETSKPKQTRKKSATKKSEDSDKKSPKPS